MSEQDALLATAEELRLCASCTVILPGVLHGCETWSLTVGKERGLRVFENRVLRRIFGPKRDELTGEWRRQHNEKIDALYSLPNIIRVIKSCSTYGREES